MRMKIKPKNKYGAKARFGFDSGAERERFNYLMLKEKAGVIRDLEKHPRVLLEAGIYFKPDNVYVENDSGLKIYEDVKGVETDRFRLLKKIWKLHGPGILRVIVKQNGKWYCKQEIKGEGRE